MTPEDYTRRYDLIVEGILRASPETKFSVWLWQRLEIILSSLSAS